MQTSGQGGNSSLLQDLLSQVPSGLFGGKDQAGKADELQANATAAQMQNTHITPRQPEAWTSQLQETQKQIYPILGESYFPSHCYSLGRDPFRMFQRQIAPNTCLSAPSPS
jgi:hypothetical protein